MGDLRILPMHTHDAHRWYAGCVSRTTIDLDDELLARAAKELGTTGKKDTIHAALRAALRKNASRALMDRMAQSTEADEDAANAMWEQPDGAASVRSVDGQAPR